MKQLKTLSKFFTFTLFVMAKQQQGKPNYNDDKIIKIIKQTHQTKTGTTNKAVLSFDSYKKYELDSEDNSNENDLFNDYQKDTAQHQSSLYTLNVDTFISMFVFIHIYIYI